MQNALINCITKAHRDHGLSGSRSNSRSQLAVLARESLPAKFQQELASRVFCGNCKTSNLFNLQHGTSDQRLILMASLHLTALTVMAKQFIYQYGDKATAIYLIVKGC